ncbi:MAG: XdhC/CoxI family protein [Rhodospirillales bacterium]|nr:MAG: XdhC/CoxI family protein [Rhodospirillales bacterium]
MGVDDAPIRHALAWLGEGRRVALATVVETWGASPRPPGSLLAVTPDGNFTGSVSGGCIEAEVITAALRVMASGRPELLHFSIGDEQAWHVGLACGGSLTVFVEPASDAELLGAICTARPIAVVTDLGDARHALVGPTSVAGGSLPLPPAAVAAACQALQDDESRRIDGEGQALFATVFNPPMRLIVVGAVHVAQALAPLATGLGFVVTVVDPRAGFASSTRFPDVDIRNDWPDDALTALRPDARTAVVTLSHDAKLDDPALEAALRSQAFYIGALGSRRTHTRRLERLSARGFPGSQLARIHGPVGLDLGGRKAAEIALAIMAEVVAVRYGRASRAARISDSGRQTASAGNTLRS